MGTWSRSSAYWSVSDLRSWHAQEGQSWNNNLSEHYTHSTFQIKMSQLVFIGCSITANLYWIRGYGKLNAATTIVSRFILLTVSH